MTTITELKARNAEAGQHFFDREAMQFFNSKVETPIYGGRFFVTSERMETTYPKRYTVRVALNDGSIEEVGEFQEWLTLEAARAEAKVYAKATAEVRFDPYPMHSDEDEATADPEHFHWRPFVDDQPVGVRNTKAKAEALAAELNA